IRFGEMPPIQKRLDAIPWGEAECVVAGTSNNSCPRTGLLAISLDAHHRLILIEVRWPLSASTPVAFVRPHFCMATNLVSCHSETFHNDSTLGYSCSKVLGRG